MSEFASFFKEKTCERQSFLYSYFFVFVFLFIDIQLAKKCEEFVLKSLTLLVEMFVEIIIPVAVKGTFTYFVPEELQEKIQIGMRVLVPFRNKEHQIGIVSRIMDTVPTSLSRIKSVSEVLDSVPVFPERTLDFYRWISEYYLCTLGETVKAALPSGLDININVFYSLAPGWKENISEELYNKTHFLLKYLAENEELSEEEVLKILPSRGKKIFLKKLLSENILLKREIAQEKYTPKKVKILSLSTSVLEDFQAAFAMLERSPKQSELLLKLIEAKSKDITVTLKRATSEWNFSPAVINALEKKGLIKKEEWEIDRVIRSKFSKKHEEVILTPSQQAVKNEISYHFAHSGKPVLLYGITGSGKTHIYIELIKEFVVRGKQVLYLLPEIALTKQIIDKIVSVFGESVGIYHSKLTSFQRVEIWRKVYNGTYQIVVGARSSLLLPFRELGLIVIDEEHDSSFKQHEPNPRYNARDAAIYYGKKFGVPVLLGSATPSMETFYNAEQGKYHKVVLKELPVKRNLPEVRIVDMKKEVSLQTSYGVFSSVLIEEIRKRLERKEQVILFRNRRGFAPYVKCLSCGYVFFCKNCDITLTYHKYSEKLSCHYCGFSVEAPEFCLQCGSENLQYTGIGTERIEEHLEELFPKARIGRMDLDTTQGRRAYEELIYKMENGKIDILVGTQMVTKGLDIKNVTLTAILEADKLLHYPDFRASEFALQLMKQFRGRAARSEKKAMFLLQTYAPENPFFQFLEEDYEEFYFATLPLRQEKKYPPFSRLIFIELRHKESEKLLKGTELFIAPLKKAFGKYLLGPIIPNIARVRNRYRSHTLIKITDKLRLTKSKQFLLETVHNYKRQKGTPNLEIIINVDPMQFG